MDSSIPTLLELQRAMRHSLMPSQGQDVAAADYVITEGLASGQRLGIYRNTTSGVLATALGLSFPAVRYLVGAEFFERAARLFAAKMPPGSAWLDEYGADFPQFLAYLPQAESLHYLADVARLEWQVNLVLHAPDARPLEIATLTGLPESELAQLCFEPHPAARLLRCAFPADAIWHAVLERDDRAMAAVDLADGPVGLLVQRTETGIEVVRLGECEWGFTAALFSRRPLRAALEDAPWDNTLPLHTLLAAHLARGCFVSASLARTAPESRLQRIAS